MNQRTPRTPPRTREQERLAALTAAVNLALIRNTDLRAALQECTDALVAHAGAAFARIWTLDEQANALELQASSGMYTHIDGAHSRVPMGKFKIGLIAEERKPHLTNSVVGDPRVGDQEWAAREGMAAFAGYPLIVEDKLVGVMAMFSRTALTEGAIRAMEAVAHGVASGIERKHAEGALIGALANAGQYARQLRDLAVSASEINASLS